MLNRLLTKIRKDNHRSKLSIANDCNLDPGYISHVENGERVPSHSALKKICKSLDVPYQQLMYTYDKPLLSNHIESDFINLVPYHSIVAVNSLDDLIKCSAEYGSASFALKVSDESMEPRFIRGSYAFVEQNSPISSREFGLFYYHGNFYIRRLNVKDSSYVLSAENPKFPNIRVSRSDTEFYAIGKIIGSNDDF